VVVDSTVVAAAAMVVAVTGNGGFVDTEKAAAGYVPQPLFF
jgi:hypothetical protein